MIKRATPPNTPNVIDGTAQAPESVVDVVRLTVRLPAVVASERLGELQARMERYVARNEKYEPQRETAKTIVVTRQHHQWLTEQAHQARLTINGFIERVLLDPHLAPPIARPAGLPRTWDDDIPDP